MVDHFGLVALLTLLAFQGWSLWRDHSDRKRLAKLLAVIHPTPAVECVGCGARASLRCSDGRCRYHCSNLCRCEDTLDVQAEVVVDRAIQDVRKDK